MLWYDNSAVYILHTSPRDGWIFHVDYCQAAHGSGEALSNVVTPKERNDRVRIWCMMHAARLRAQAKQGFVEFCRGFGYVLGRDPDQTLAFVHFWSEIDECFHLTEVDSNCAYASGKISL